MHTHYNENIWYFSNSGNNVPEIVRLLAFHHFILAPSMVWIFIQASKKMSNWTFNKNFSGNVFTLCSCVCSLCQNGSGDYMDNICISGLLGYRWSTVPDENKRFVHILYHYISWYIWYLIYFLMYIQSKYSTLFWLATVLNKYVLEFLLRKIRNMVNISNFKSSRLPIVMSRTDAQNKLNSSLTIFNHFNGRWEKTKYFL